MSGSNGEGKDKFLMRYILGEYFLLGLQQRANTRDSFDKLCKIFVHMLLRRRLADRTDLKGSPSTNHDEHQ